MYQPSLIGIRAGCKDEIGYRGRLLGRGAIWPENFESIHSHNAYAEIERDKRE